MTSENTTGDPDDGSITFQDIIDTVERIVELDQRRRDAVAAELDGELDRFPKTRDVIAREWDQLDDLRDLLDEETANLSTLIERTDHLKTDQAVRHREETVRKIRQHNDALQQFVSEMEALLDVVESNLDLLESKGDTAELQGSQGHLDGAKRALEEHNDAVDGLDTNLRILGAYLP